MDEPPSTGAAGRDIPTLVTGLLAGAVVLMGAVASAKGWIPTGDDAFLSLRTRHLFSTDPILLNNASSAGPSAGSQYNHPGAFPLTLLARSRCWAALAHSRWRRRSSTRRVSLIAFMVRRIAGRPT